MKRFVIKSVLFLVLLVAILFAGSAVYTNSHAYQNLKIHWWTENYDEMPEQIDVAVFGASHGRHAFRFAPEGHSFFNFALSLQMPEYDLMLMRQYADRIQPGALVVLTVSYMSPYWPEHDINFETKQPRYYRLLSAENMIDYDPWQAILNKYFPVLTESPQLVIGSILHREMPSALYSDGPLRQEDIPGDVQDSLDGYANYIEYIFPETNPVMMDAYRQMLTMCQDNGWTAVLVTPPYLEQYNACYPDEFYPAFYAAVDSLCEQFDVPYLDVSHDETYYERYDLFYELSHLNISGGERFSAEFFAEIARRGIWE